MGVAAARRVVITGAGCVGPLGNDARQTWAAMRAGASGVGPLRRLPADQMRVQVSAEVRDFDPAAHFDAKRLALLDPISQYAVVAAREAVAQAGLDVSAPGLSERAAVVVGVGVGAEATRDESFRRLYGEGNPRVHPLTIVRLMANAPASQVSIDLGLRGPAFVVSSACASSNHALAQAVSVLRGGQADIALAGGADACLTMGVVKAWEAMRLLADEACRPFSLQRRGLVLGEGAGMFVLETLEHARRRGATILAELAGAGMSADASDIVMPEVGGAVRAMTAALADAGWQPAQVDYINAHGTGTQANDATETRAIRETFGPHADALLVSSTKSMHGHLLGAAGAIEMIAVLGALREHVVPPTTNFLDPDPACDLDYVPNVARPHPVRAALSNSFAFGGLNAVLAVSAWEGDPPPAG